MWWLYRGWGILYWVAFLGVKHAFSCVFRSNLSSQRAWRAEGRGELFITYTSSVDFSVRLSSGASLCQLEGLQIQAWSLFNQTLRNHLKIHSPGWPTCLQIWLAQSGSSTPGGVCVFLFCFLVESWLIHNRQGSPFGLSWRPIFFYHIIWELLNYTQSHHHPGFQQETNASIHKRICAWIFVADLLII